MLVCTEEMEVVVGMKVREFCAWLVYLLVYYHYCRGAKLCVIKKKRNKDVFEVSLNAPIYTRKLTCCDSYSCIRVLVSYVCIEQH